MSGKVHVVCPQCGAVNRVPGERLDQGPKCGKCRNPVTASGPLNLDAAGLTRQVQKGDLPVLVDFWASWCGPCKMMAPAFEQAAGMLGPGVRLAKVNTEQEQALAGQLGIQSIPTMVLFKGGREVDRVSGAMNAASIAQWARARL